MAKVKNLNNKLDGKSTKKSFYVWGDVGRGKTLITKSFFNLLTERKASFHYMEFMQSIHEQLSNLPGKKNPLNIIARDLSKRCKVIFIDEFQALFGDRDGGSVVLAQLASTLLQCMDDITRWSSAGSPEEDNNVLAVIVTLPRQLS